MQRVRIPRRRGTPRRLPGLPLPGTGVLEAALAATVDEAFDVLRRHARSRNLRLSDLANDVAQHSPATADLLRGADETGAQTRRSQTA
jgi:hypothetical protein